MLDDFRDSQKVAYNLIVNSLNSNTISHAYLVNTNNNFNALNFILALVKAFLCPNHYTDKSMCDGCFLCNRIDGGNYPELRIIEPDGMWIKKNQILELQDDFNMLPVEGEKRIYVIKEADKMNQQTANSILKFLEEPNSDIVAILVTDNVSNMLETIVSRCQLINLNKNLVYNDKTIENLASISCNSVSEVKNFIVDERNLNFLNLFLSFIKFYENNNFDVMLYPKKYWNVISKDRDQLVVFFDLIINFYYDVLNFILINEINFFKDYSDVVIDISKNNSVDVLINKIFICISFKDKLKFNCNLNLFFDKFIIELGGVYGRYCLC